jgi:hypothetical protein
MDPFLFIDGAIIRQKDSKENAPTPDIPGA